ncbi:type VII secretion-associated serine protease mycosin [Solihabitans fulvus]|uniref:Type VII secretion-associated serine protease mycosin n=1 Tax=Solihabitans fulvus TaxID=1892852 RepID=A0A5B2XPA5_9PSEU|nr:type VII secretion-associated serine protease mycosin [Solihabitans fulvus]KAA2264699.1 type VII secretion-associated serine protease mycosin [Solihabitans fulvus]
MRSTRMRALAMTPGPRGRKSLAAGATALILLAGLGGTPQAMAQSSKPSTGSSASPTAKTPATPPPVDMSKLALAPVEKPAKAGDYELKNACITSNVTTDLANKPWGQQQLQIEEAQRFATGKGQTVAVIDTGVNPHPRFGDRLTQGGDYVAAPGTTPTDCDGHGTEVAGIIAAGRDPKTGFVGVAPDAKILALRQTSGNFALKTPNGTAAAGAGDLIALAKAIHYAADQGAKVINMSVTLCVNAPYTPVDSVLAVQAAIHDAVEKHDVVVVAAAGNVDPEGCPAQNDDPDPNNVHVIALPPWFSDDVLSVAAIARSGEPASFTVWGPWVNIAGPGTEITSLDPGPGSSGLTNSLVRNNKPEALQGTSFASPYVAGVAALVRERFPELSAREVMSRLERTAQHPGNPSGRDNKVGYGMVNPIAALTAVLPDEKGVAAARPTPVNTSLNQVPDKNWMPMVVALSGTGIGVGLLLLTLFIMHTINRVRTRREGSGARA